LCYAAQENLCARPSRRGPMPVAVFTAHAWGRIGIPEVRSPWHSPEEDLVRGRAVRGCRSAEDHQRLAGRQLSRRTSGCVAAGCRCAHTRGVPGQSDGCTRTRETRSDQQGTCLRAQVRDAEKRATPTSAQHPRREMVHPAQVLAQALTPEERSALFLLWRGRFDEGAASELSRRLRSLRLAEDHAGALVITEFGRSVVGELDHSS
jgi:hypothetical protein